MTGWNLPPGCSVSDIPGNRPEDDRYEAFCETLEAAFQQHMPPGEQPELSDTFVEAVWKMMGAAFSDGYSQAQADAADGDQHDHVDAASWEQSSWLGG